MVAEHLGVWTVGEIQLVIYEGRSRGNWMAQHDTRRHMQPDPENL
jgi:hypothetical protein